MNLKNEFKPIEDWAIAKGIISKGDLKTQFLKLSEEVGELGKAILMNNEDEFVDAIGDVVIVLTSLAKLGSNHFDSTVNPDKERITIAKCINDAYKVVSKRNGSMIQGNFVKETK